VIVDPVEARMLGSLAEKQLTTPQQYPLTLNALLLACNQTSNRDPVVTYEEDTVLTALSSLKERGFLRFVHPSHGRSVVRYRQVMDERFGLDDRGLSILTVLLLRGPQTVGELRIRTERMADFGGLDDVESELGRLQELPDPLVRRLERQPGQKEERWVQLLTGEPVAVPAVRPEPSQRALREPSASDEVISLRSEVASLSEEVSRLRDELVSLRTAVDELRAPLGG
jgi:uncharacterized protein YceH (UPF0502 family)